MRHLRDDTVLILDGEVRVYRRERSRRWQAAFSIKIEDSEIQSCFDRFSQIGENSGSGLGLAIVYEIAKIHQGEVMVTTKPRMRFTFSIPTKVSQDF